MVGYGDLAITSSREDMKLKIILKIFKIPFGGWRGATMGFEYSKAIKTTTTYIIIGCDLHTWAKVAARYNDRRGIRRGVVFV